MVKGKKTADGAYAISLKPSAEVREALKKAADAAGRTLNKEMELRLAASVHGDHAPADLYPGWPAESELRFRSLANVVGILCSKIELTHGTTGGHERLLAALKSGLLSLFERLGVQDVRPDEQAFFEIVAWQMAAEFGLARTTTYRTAELAAFADFVRAWGVNANGKIK